MSYNADGRLKATSVAGNSYTGLYAADGSFNIVLNAGNSYTGLYHPCGALNAVVGTATTYYHISGGVNVISISGGYALAVPFGSVTGPTPPAVFAGDLIAWNGIYGLMPMTQTVWNASFGAPSAANKAFDYQLWDGTAGGATGSIYFQNGKLDTTTMSNLVGLSNNNQFYGTKQIRITSFTDQSGNGNHLVPGRHDGTPTLKQYPTVGVVNGMPMIFMADNGNEAALTCNLSAGQQMSTDHFTMAACVRPFKTYIDGNGNGGSIVYSGAILGDGNGMALKNNLNTYASNWGCINAAVPPAALAVQSSSNMVSCTITQTLTANACEIGVGADSTTYNSRTGGSFTTAGFTLGGGPTSAGFNNYFGGIIFCAMHTNIFVNTTTTAQIRSALNGMFNVPSIDESKNIVVNGLSTANGANCYGVPQIAGIAADATKNGTLSYPWSNFLADRLSNKRIAVVSRDSYDSDYFGEMILRIPAIAALYKNGKDNIHYISTQLAMPTITAAQYITGTTGIKGLSDYLTSFASGTAGQTWRIFVGGLSPIQTSPLASDVNALLISNAGSLGYTYVDNVSLSTWNTEKAKYAVDEFILSGHYTCTSANLVGTTEGNNLAAVI